MQKEELLVFDQEDESIADLISHCEESLKHQEARVLWYIMQKEKVNSKDVARALDLHQPQVSDVLNKLRKNGWVSYEEEKLERGRPQFLYFPSLTRGRLFSVIEKHQHERMKKMKEKLESLKKQIAQ